MMAQSGHPLLGDGKYGSERFNRKYGKKRQALWSWKLTFRFTTDAGELAYLDGQSWQMCIRDRNGWCRPPAGG